MSTSPNPWLIGIRHHSPACARMLLDAAEELRPAAIAVEMPADLHDHLPLLTHPDTVAPVAIAARAGKTSGIFPFADFSPELAIMRWAREHDVPVHFIDLPLASREYIASEAPAEDEGAQPNPIAGENAAWNEELDKVLSQAGWERNVEAPAVGAHWREVHRAARAVGDAARLTDVHGPRGIGQLNARREEFMRARMHEMPEKTMCVVGAYHCTALDDARPSDLHAAPKPVGSTQQDTTSAVVPYSFSLLDSRSGYGAGIRDPHWHQAIFEGTDNVVARFLVAAAHAARTLGLTAGTGELAEANRMAEDLARLRGLPAPGRGEFIEAVTSVCAQGDVMGAGRAWAKALETALIGHKEGRLPAGSPESPLVASTQKTLAELNLPHRTTTKLTSLRVDPFTSSTGLRRHVVFNQLDALGVVYSRRGERRTVRHLPTRSYTVECLWTTSTHSQLVTFSAAGVDLEQAVNNHLLSMLLDPELPALDLIAIIDTAAGCAADGALQRALELIEETHLDSFDFSATARLISQLTAIIGKQEAATVLLSSSTLEACLNFVETLNQRLVVLGEGIIHSNERADARALGELSSLGAELPLASSRFIQRIKATGSPLMRGAAHAVAPDSSTQQAVSSWTHRHHAGFLTGFLSALGPMWPESEQLDTFIEHVESAEDATFISFLPNLRSVFDGTSALEREAFLDRLAEHIGHVSTASEFSPSELAEFAAHDHTAQTILTQLGLADLSFDPATRWRLILGAQPQQLTGEARSIGRNLDELYGASPDEGGQAGDGRVVPGHRPGTLATRTWKGEIKAQFGEDEADIIMGEAFERGRLNVLDDVAPEAVTPNVDNLSTMLNLVGALTPAQLRKIRPIIDFVIKELADSLATELQPALSHLSSSRITRRDTKKLALAQTLRANMKHVVRHGERTYVVPVHPRFFETTKAQSPWHIIVVVDVSASMEPSTVYSAMTAAIFAGVPALKVSFVVFTTEVMDLTEHVHDPLTLLLEISLGGGTDINCGLRYAEQLVKNPSKTAIVLITDFDDSQPLSHLLSTVKRLRDSGVTLLGCASLDDEGEQRYNAGVARSVASVGMEVASVSPLGLARWVAKVAR